MKIGVKGQELQIIELKAVLPKDISVVPLKISDLETYDMIFDLDFDTDASFHSAYLQFKGTLILGATKRSLDEIDPFPSCTVIGLNSLPSFINRDVFECTSLNKSSQLDAGKILEEIGVTASFVNSRVGMVTPRIICMIINEAFFTVQEGTASREDIDLGMKLGTAYPKGPFEWCDAIGVVNVYETLDAIYRDTRDERYKICPALKKAYLAEIRSSAV